jgi:hypothetical protein
VSVYALGAAKTGIFGNGFHQSLLTGVEYIASG